VRVLCGGGKKEFKQNCGKDYLRREKLSMTQRSLQGYVVETHAPKRKNRYYQGGTGGHCAEQLGVGRGEEVTKVENEALIVTGESLEESRLKDGLIKGGKI